MRDWIFENKNQVEELREKIISEADASVDELLCGVKGIHLLELMKFEQVGYDSILEEKTNFIEQINQTFTYLVSLQALEYLMIQFPNKSFKVNFGVISGHDIESLDGTVICECFASTTPTSNNKLAGEVKRLDDKKTANNKYVIFYSRQKKPQHLSNLQSKYPDVHIIQLSNII